MLKLYPQCADIWKWVCLDEAVRLEPLSGHKHLLSAKWQHSGKTTTSQEVGLYWEK